MLRDLNKCCDGASQWFYSKGYDETAELDYQHVYNEMLEFFGASSDDNFGNSGSLKFLRDLEHSAEAILYYPDRVIYHNEYSIFSSGVEYISTSIEMAKNKKQELIDNYTNRNNLLERYLVTLINITLNDTEKSYEVLGSCVTLDELNESSWYWVQNRDGVRFDVYGKENVLLKVEEIYQSEIEEMKSLFIIEQKIEDTVDGFTAWIPVLEN